MTMTHKMQRIVTQPRVIVALDFSNETALWSLVEKLNPADCRLKIGKELFTSQGPDLVRRLTQRGFDVFLDLKFHDIPNTVAKAVSAAADLGVWMVNVHASGGAKMLDAARAALSAADGPLLIAVTVLTSLQQSDLTTVGVNDSVEQQVQRLTRLAANAGFDGVVCSAHEAASVKQLTNTDFLTITPGVRPQGAAVQDQQRIMTPREALRNQADYLVIGRPITQADNPVSELLTINSDINEYLAQR
ncbi:MAG: orotidine-5'-phosphate decarboxylase [Gammaproteobacteria bacterium]|nr:orotidine-5'-phosphate decarboxylase [Gammaproteobacteria bacterium]